MTTTVSVPPGDDPANHEEATTADPKKKQCCSCDGLRFDGNAEAQGYALSTCARGAIIMSNIFISTAFIRLAEESAGCIFHDDDDTVETPECDVKVYGFLPTSLLTMIAVVSGVLSACLLPVIGAVVDYTSHRRTVGVLSAAWITVVQGLQIWLNQSTWFPMAILQAINGFMYMVQVMAVYAYLPDIAREVGEGTMLSWTVNYTIIQFTAQVSYLIVNIAVQLPLAPGDVLAAQISQGICVVWIVAMFTPGWRRMSPVPALHARPPGRSLARIGFAQNWKTLKGVVRHYRSGLMWFFLAVAFGEAGANAFTVVAVTFMVGALGMGGTEVGLIFLVTLLSTVPGSKLGKVVAERTNPIASLKVDLVVFTIVTVVGGLVLTGPDRKILCYPFGVLWGINLGWFYPLENLIFALGVPRGQESEFSGFYTYCRSILTWLPPLIFTVINEAGVHMRWGLMSLVIFLLIGVAFLQLMDPWGDVLEAAKVNKVTGGGGEADGGAAEKKEPVVPNAVAMASTPGGMEVAA